jgi:DNA-binding CsgD family transcriptional regulator
MTAIISDSSPAAREKGAPPLRPAGQGVLRGRQAERKVVSDLLRRTQRGLGGVVLVEGEPGIGKSMLLRDSTGEAAGRGFSLAEGAADQLCQVIPFFALRVALGEPFALDDSGRDLPHEPGRWISQMRARLEQRAAAAPVLVCLDDLHWASPATLAVLRALPRELRWCPVAWILGRSSTPRHGAEHLFGLLEKDGAAGNPSVLTELISGLREDSAVEVTCGHAALVSARLPRRMHLVARQRLDGVSERARHLLETAAVLGPSFRLEDTAEMLGETPAMLLPTVEEAMGAGIMTAAENAFSFRHELLRRAVSDMIPRPARKALHRQYGQILLSRGRSAALAACHLLQAAHPGDPASLADLDAAAVQTLRSAPQTAADLAQRAREMTPPADPDALARSVAAAEALTAAGRLDQAERIAQHTMAKPLPPVAEARLRCILSSVLCARGQAQDAAAEARRVLAWPQLPDDLRDQATTAYLHALTGLRDDLAGPVADAILASPGRCDSHAVVAALVTRAVISLDGGQIGEGLQFLREAARHGTGISPDARHFQPLLALAAAFVDLGQLGEAEEILHAADSQVLRGIPAQAALYILRARIHLACGRLGDAAAAAETALATAEAQGANRYAWTAHCVLAVVALRRGDLADAAQHIAGRPAGRPPLPDTYARAETTVAEAQIAEMRDGPAAAIGHLSRVCADLPARSGLLLGDPATTAWLVRAALAAGDDELAARAARAAEALADANPGFPALTAAAAHGLGLASRDPARLAEAAAEHPDPWARASAAEDLGVLHARQGERELAIHHLKAALAGYRQVGADRDHARIRQRLRKLGIHRRHWATSPARPVTGWDSLTDTEQSIARLVTQGLNNNQVAGRMYISTHTVAAHLRQAFRKLHISSRVELARVVIEGPSHR